MFNSTATMFKAIIASLPFYTLLCEARFDEEYEKDAAKHSLKQLKQPPVVTTLRERYLMELDHALKKYKGCNCTQRKTTADEIFGRLKTNAENFAINIGKLERGVPIPGAVQTPMLLFQNHMAGLNAHRSMYKDCFCGREPIDKSFKKIIEEGFPHVEKAIKDVFEGLF